MDENPKGKQPSPGPGGGKVDSERLARNVEHLMKRYFSVVAASVIAGSGATLFSGCEALLGVVGLADSQTTVNFPEKDAVGIKINQTITKTLKAGDLLYFSYLPGNFWVTVSVESLELRNGASLRYATSSGAPSAGTIVATLGEKIVDSLPDQANFICIQCISGDATIVFKIKDSFAASANVYSDWVDNWSNSVWTDNVWTNSYSDSYSRYAAYSDSWLNYSNFWSNSW